MSNRLVMVGDSILKGVMYNSERERYCMYDDSWFIHTAAKRGTVIEKRCKMGATIEYGLDSASSIEEGINVLLEFGGNDSNYNWIEVASSPYSEHSPATPPERFREMYSNVIERVRQCGATPIIVNLAPIESENFFKWITRTADGANVLKWLGDKNMLYRWHEYYSHITEEVARAKGCRLVDLRSGLLRSRAFYNMIGGDGLHPNEKGHTLIREILLDLVC